MGIREGGQSEIYHCFRTLPVLYVPPLACSRKESLWVSVCGYTCVCECVHLCVYICVCVYFYVFVCVCGGGLLGGGTGGGREGVSASPAGTRCHSHWPAICHPYPSTNGAVALKNAFGHTCHVPRVSSCLHRESIPSDSITACSTAEHCYGDLCL